jgi:hypothetical protein
MGSASQHFQLPSGMAACETQLAPCRSHEPDVVNSALSYRNCRISPEPNQTKDSWTKRAAHVARAMGT